MVVAGVYENPTRFQPNLYNRVTIRLDLFQGQVLFISKVEIYTKKISEIYKGKVYLFSSLVITWHIFAARPVVSDTRLQDNHLISAFLDVRGRSPFCAVLRKRKYCSDKIIIYIFKWFILKPFFGSCSIGKKSKLRAVLSSIDNNLIWRRRQYYKK